MIDLAERRRAANQDLRVLDEAHRLGRITRAEYRARRRRLLESLYDPSAVVTARNTLVPPAATTTPRPRSAAPPRDDASADSASHALTSLLAMRPATRWKSVGVVVLLLVIALGALAYGLLHG
ncbi:hypothetical protein [Rhodanobacter lindaniclasticus]|uniref:SHOCT domain-containing protein n=1 Tax=Rhodanobacter lindaniclasticus TaxID=75310 RepID=A0A4S3KDK4_9GAMM|nr:hypothetical protein [Rhodanobacter lindaniclasticus]THD06479.1 hypothetical protein B1991_12670 [Rhodanobacter lindaniclasticus]